MVWCKVFKTLLQAYFKNAFAVNVQNHAREPLVLRRAVRPFHIPSIPDARNELSSYHSSHESPVFWGSGCRLFGLSAPVVLGWLLEGHNHHVFAGQSARTLERLFCCTGGKTTVLESIEIVPRQPHDSDFSSDEVAKLLAFGAYNKALPAFKFLVYLRCDPQCTIYHLDRVMIVRLEYSHSNPKEICWPLDLQGRP